MIVAPFMHAQNIEELLDAAFEAHVDDICTDEFLQAHQHQSWVWFLCALRSTEHRLAAIKDEIPKNNTNPTLTCIKGLKSQERGQWLALLEVMRQQDHQALGHWFRLNPRAPYGGLVAVAKVVASLNEYGWSSRAPTIINLLIRLSLKEQDAFEVLVASCTENTFLALKIYLQQHELLPKELNRMLMSYALDHQNCMVVHYLRDEKNFSFSTREIRDMMTQLHGSSAYQRRALGLSLCLGFEDEVLMHAVRNREIATVRALLIHIQEQENLIQAFHAALMNYSKPSMRNAYFAVIEAFVSVMKESDWPAETKALLLVAAVFRTQAYVTRQLLLAGADGSLKVEIGNSNLSALEHAQLLQEEMKVDDRRKPWLDQIVRILREQDQSDRAEQPAARRPRENRRTHGKPSAAAAAVTAPEEQPAAHTRTPNLNDSEEFPELLRVPMSSVPWGDSVL